MTTNHDPERHALKLTIIGSLTMGVLGFVSSVVTGSEAILLDGIFSSINAVIGFITLRVAALIRRPDDSRYQFGYASFEPLTNTIKGLIILLVCCFALISSIVTLRTGGREMEMGWGSAYAVIAGIGCFAIAAVQRQAARSSGSPLIEVEVKSWTIDGLMSAAVAVAFGISFLLKDSELAGWLPYVDPVVVIALSLAALGLPLGIIRQNLSELLLAAPPVKVRNSLEERIRAVAHELPVRKIVIRTIKIGRQHWALVHMLVEPRTRVGAIEDLDEVREAIVSELAQIEPTWVVDVVFVADEKRL